MVLIWSIYGYGGFNMVSVLILVQCRCGIDTGVILVSFFFLKNFFQFFDEFFTFFHVFEFGLKFGMLFGLNLA